MTYRTLLACGALWLTAHVAVWGTFARAWSVGDHLDAYVSGEYDAVVRDLETRAARNDLGDVLSGLKRDAHAWIDAGGPDERDRRVLAAATYALEAGRAGAFSEWKWVQRYMTEVAIYWRPPPELIEWGCQLLQREASDPVLARVWHLAAMAAGQRAGDFEFLIGSPFDVRHNTQNAIEHLNHSRRHFPDESRFTLGQAIAIEWMTYPARRAPGAGYGPGARIREATQAFSDLVRDPDVGAEALVRLGGLQMRSGRTADAVETLLLADRETRDPYLVYLASYFRGQAHQRADQTADAEAAYLRALAAVPRGQSASIALSALLFQIDRRAEGSELVEAALLAPMPIDPWREYARADDRFWPRLIAQLRGMITP
jgi:hypothetical protein